MQVAGVVACAVLVLLAGCSNGNDNGTQAVSVPQEFAVGMTTLTFVDTSRPTAAHASIPEEPSRTIATTVLYPAQ